jgi:GNAT superfamily N-acetyltransferase
LRRDIAMLDKSVPYYKVTMVLENTDKVKEYPLPEGYRFCLYGKGDEIHWAEIETTVGEFDSVPKGIAYFANEFGKGLHEMEKRCLFIETVEGRKIATATAWYGQHQGKRLGRLHWISVRPDHQGKGLGKALIARALKILGELEDNRMIYLTTQTWSYKAIGLYKSFGFKPYYDYDQALRGSQAGDAEGYYRNAWALIDEKIREYTDYKGRKNTKGRGNSRG